MEYGAIQIPPVRPDAARRRSLTRDDLRQSEFECDWAGEPDFLEDVIQARVDWGPFEVSCRRHPRFDDRCLCTVHYSGPIRDRPHLMASFWNVMERFPFYLGQLQAEDAAPGEPSSPC